MSLIKGAHLILGKIESFSSEDFFHVLFQALACMASSGLSAVSCGPRLMGEASLCPKFAMSQPYAFVAKKAQQYSGVH